MSRVVFIKGSIEVLRSGGKEKLKPKDFNCKS